MQAREGGFHVKAAGLELARTYVAVKTNGNFPLNGERFGLPTIQGVVLLCDGANGSPLALLDSLEAFEDPTGCARGARGEQGGAHAAEEWVEIDSLVDLAAILVRAAQAFCGTAEGAPRAPLLDEL